MAIIPDVPNVVVDIVVDGDPLPEYLDEDDDEAVTPNSTTKYVECVSGSRFGMRTDFVGLERQHLSDGDAIETAYYVDGQRVDGTVLYMPKKLVHVHRAARYMEGGIWKEQEFSFADLVTSEDGALGKPRPELKDLGTITVKLYRVQAGKSEYRDYADYKVKVGHTNIHEKHLKGQAISTQAKLGEARSIGRVKTASITRIGDDAFGTFNFRYRSHKDLQALGLIPRSPSPIPLEDRPEESLSREEALELLRRHKARQEEQVKIKKELKREHIENESDDEPTMISHHPANKKQRLSANATVIEAIDLTDD